MGDFEQIPEIAERIKRSKMELQDNGNYWAPEWDSQSCCDQDFVNNFKKGWQHQQAIIDDLRSQLNNMEACYIEKKKEVEELRGKSRCIKSLVEQRNLAENMLRKISVAAQKKLPTFGAALRFSDEVKEILRGANG